MRPQKKIWFVLLIGLLSVFKSNYSCSAESYRPVTQYPGVIQVSERGQEPLPEYNGYTPKFSKEESKATPTTADKSVDVQQLEESEFDDIYFKGKVATFTRKNASDTNLNSGSVLYTNMGRSKNKMVNIRMSFKSNYERIALSLDETHALGVYFAKSSVKTNDKTKIDIKYEFLDEDLKPLTINGHWTYSQINTLKKLMFNRHQFDKYYVKNNADFHYSLNGDQALFTNSAFGNLPTSGDVTFLTLTFNNKSELNSTIQGVDERPTFGVFYNSESLGKITNFEIFSKGKTIRGQNRNQKVLTYEIEQRVPHVDPKAYFTEYSIQAPLSPKLEVAASDVKIVNDLGENRTNLFDVSVVNNKLSIVAKKNGDRVTNPEFYDRRYSIRINSKTIDAEKNNALKLQIEPVLKINGQEIISNKAEAHFDPTTENDVKMLIKRTDEILNFENVVLDTAKIKKADYRMIEFTLPEGVKVVTKKVAGKDEIELPEKWFQLVKSDDDDQKNNVTLSMEGNNDVEVIKDFLESVRFRDDNPEGKLSDASIKITLFSDVYTSQIGEDGVRHYYQFVSKPNPSDNEGYTWFDAYNDAKKMRYRGMRGYLATLTSYKEHAFVYDNIAKYSGYFGGTRMIDAKTKQMINDPVQLDRDINKYNYDRNEAKKWYWANGPEAGEVFYHFATYKDYLADPRSDEAKTPVYHGFNNPKNMKFTVDDPPEETEKPRGEEPNDSGGREAVTQFAQRGKWWNDIPYNTYITSKILGFYVEFSPYGGEVEVDTDEDEIQAIASAKIPAPIQQEFISTKNGSTLKGVRYYANGIKIGDKRTLTTAGIQYYEPQNLVARVQTISATPQKIVDKYKPNEYKLIHDLNGGTSTEPIEKIFTMEDQSVKLLDTSAVTKKGYKLTGWTLRKNDPVGVKYSPGQSISTKELRGSLTLYAEWEISEVTMTVNYWLKNKNNQLEPLKDLENGEQKKDPVKVPIQVETVVMSKLQPLIDKKLKGYSFAEATLKNGTNNFAPLPELVPKNNFEVNLIYRGSLELQAPKELTFVKQKILATKQKRIPLTKMEKVDVTNTQGSASAWKLGVRLQKEMTNEASQKLLGQMYYQETAVAQPKLISTQQMTTLKTETNAAISNQLNLFSADNSVGLYLDVFTGNLKGKYDEGILYWELQNVE